MVPPTDAGAAGAALIDVSDEAEVRRWAEKLAVSVEALREAITAAGNRADRVGEYLLRLRADDHRPPL
ncbi:DUF3606 domain-containing protein [Aquabacterium sp. A7-Y]|uniref:DUF3606 domain-containing protein n=1 Tax=Aquabacterium sp. A7-Y TaxID=1349605 RepID=UPI00223C8EE9|nr:DUF3606 domain-containing protein [Aquabacterium sp. A7-Y]MCW7538456.1 DUF3606 domain-containing protein [Aquabacterium sp. A7-Y]